jgi:hypothetical protein
MANSAVSTANLDSKTLDSGAGVDGSVIDINFFKDTLVNPINALFTNTTNFGVAAPIFERNRSVAMGVGVNVVFANTNFTGSGSMTWDVGASDVQENHYSRVGNNVHYTVGLNTTTVGGTPSTDLRVAIPTGTTIARTTRNALAIVTNNGSQAVGYVEAVAGNSFVSCKLNIGGTNWSASSNNTAVFFQIWFEVTG